MKNSKKGFIIPLLLVIIAVLVVGGGVYVYKNKKAEVPAIVDTGAQPVNQNQQQTNTQTPPVSTKKNAPDNPSSNTTEKITSTEPFITILSPNGGEVYKAGDSITIKDASGNLPSGRFIQVYLSSSALLGRTYSPFTLTTINTLLPEEFSITLPSVLLRGSDYIVTVCSRGNPGSSEICGKSGGFTVTPVSPSPHINIISPNGGEIYKIGDKMNITWSASGIESSGLVLSLVSENGTYTTFHETKSGASGSYSWSIPSGMGPVRYKLSIFTISTQILEDRSESYFTILSN